MNKKRKSYLPKLLTYFLLCILLITIIFQTIRFIAQGTSMKIGIFKNSEKDELLSPTTGVPSYFLTDNLRQYWVDMYEPQEKNVCWAYAACKAMEASLYRNGSGPVNLDEHPLIQKVENWKSSKGITVAGGSDNWVWNHYLRYGYGPKDEKGTYPVGTINVRSVEKIDADINKVKDKIFEYGGVTASVAWTGAGQNYHGTYNGYNVMATTFNAQTTHAICLLGWDDNFSKSNFPSSWGVTQNGAFWAYNPAGGQELWVSYQDTNVWKYCYYYDARVESNQWSVSNPGPRLSDPYWDPDDPGYAAYHKKIDSSSIEYTHQGVTFSQGYTNVRWTYTGEKIYPQVTTIKNTDGTQLFEGKDFNVYYYHSQYTDPDIDNQLAGHRGIIHVWGINDYDGQSIIQMFAIDQKEISSSNTIVTLEKDKVQYNGQALTITDVPIKSVVCDSKALTLNTDYTVSYSVNTSTSKGTATITGKGNYKGSVAKNFDLITGYNIGDASVCLVEVDWSKHDFFTDWNDKWNNENATGKPKIATVTNLKTNKVLKEDTDYVTTFFRNGDVITIVLKGKNDYRGSANKTTSTFGVTLEYDTCEYDGTAKRPNASVTYYNQAVDSKNYSISYSNNINAGKANVIVTIKPNFNSGTSRDLVKQFEIEPKYINAEMVTVPTKTYDKEPNIIVKDGSKTLVKDTDYFLTYRNNTEPGLATVIVDARNNYIGVVIKNYTIEEEENDTPEPEDEKLEVKIQEKYAPIRINSVGYLSNIPLGTTVEDFKNGIRTNGTITLYYAKANATPTAYLKTGMKMKVEKNGESVEYFLVVKGDVTGDGKRDGADLLKVARYIAELDLNLNGAYEIAANVNSDNNSDGKVIINAKDLLRLARMLLFLD